MNGYDYAFYRTARQVMTPAEVRKARALARAGETGDQAAAQELRKLVNKVLDANRIVPYVALKKRSA